VATVEIFIWDIPISNLDQTSAVLTEVFRDFPRYLYGNAGIVL
jgi:hypothetical protein